MVLMKVKDPNGNIVSIPLGVSIDNGKTPYDYAIEHGYIGTEEEFATALVGIDTLEPKISELEAVLGTYLDEDIIGLSADFENNTFVRLAAAEGLDAGEDFDRFPVYGNRVRCNVADDGTINAICGSGEFVPLCEFQEAEISEGSPSNPETGDEEDIGGNCNISLTTTPHPNDSGNNIKIYVDNVTTGELYVFQSTLAHHTDGLYVNKIFGTFKLSNNSDCLLTGWPGAYEAGGYYEPYFQFFTYPYTTDTLKIKVELEKDSEYADDGSNGQCMVYQPAFYYKVAPVKLEKQEDGIGYHIRKANYYISSTSKPGFKLHPAFYDVNGNPVEYILYSAYEDNVDGGERDLAFSIAGIDIYACGAVGPQAELYAQYRGENWHIEDMQAISANRLLMMIECGTPNVRSILGEGLDAAAGATSGLTSNLGNTSGSINGAISYRGMENPYGNIDKHVYGFHLEGFESETRKYKPFIVSNNRFHSRLGDAFCQFTVGIDTILPVGSVVGGYASAFGYGTEEYDWLLLPSEAAGEGSDIEANDQKPIGAYISYDSAEEAMTNVYGGYDSPFNSCYYNGEYGGAGCRLMYLPVNHAEIE